ncbi:heavy metal-responsive transcriptional regulator [Microbulbifer magnicolonia]|uniref:heavy metal-responsive transcriptional regulator n=1 Tax=Microbulbifer magnicolonia TaxID=3109744 RepID=UPI002B40F33A|nr:heavy metal-responsive transcriptional regulator [Microbulbifer sp. GG15]
MKRIGEVAAALGVGVDTLRYYEKIRLLPAVARDGAGLRLYSEKDLSRLRFIRRAQKMGFSLEEISRLLEFRENPQGAKPQVRRLAQAKLEQLEASLADLAHLRDELRLLTSLCRADVDGCPILQNIEGNHEEREQNG